MMSFSALAFFTRSLFGLWALLLCLSGFIGLIFALGMKRIHYGFPSLLISIATYCLWQINFNLNAFGGTAVNPISLFCGDLPWLVWFTALLLFSAVSAITLYYIIRHAQTAVTPLAVKLCADKMACGICYWRDNGRVIFANDCMNHLSIALTERPLQNGNRFREKATDGTKLIGAEMWNFAGRDFSFGGEPLHELIAWDVTEIHAKTEQLRRDNAELSHLNEELKAYDYKIDESVRRQEILQAKVNIHAEMNRLMLYTSVADGDDAEALDRIFVKWQQNALLLCLDAEEKSEQNAANRLKEMAQLLGIQINWLTEFPQSFTVKQRELFFTAAHEGLINAVKHGHADTMEIKFTETEKIISCCFENNGTIAQNSVEFTGGLKSLDFLAKEQGAVLTAEADKTFRLTLCFKK